MNELIQIVETENGQVVSARELYSFLEVKNHFTQWIKDNINQFDEGVDYEAIKVKVNASNGIGGTNKHDYALTLDCAKEMAMLSRVAKGKVARKYFIECEKQLKQYALPQTFSEALRLLADTKEREEQAKLELTSAKETIEENKPKVVFADSVTGSSNSILIRKFAKDLCDDGFDIGQNRLFQWFRTNGYLNNANEPYQNYLSQGLFEVITRSIGGGEETFTTKTTKVTGKGQVYFAKKIKG